MAYRYEPFANPKLMASSVPIITATEVKIKKIIRDGVLLHRNETITFNLIRKAIDNMIEHLPDDYPNKQQARVEMATSSIKWYQKFQKEYMVVLLGLGLVGLSHKDIMAKRNTTNVEKRLVEQYVNRLDSLITKLSEEAIRDYSKPKSLGIFARSELETRYNMHMEKLNEFIMNGETLKRFSAHKDCSERCEPWQGKLVDLQRKSVDGTMWTGQTYKGEKVYSFTDITNQVDKYGYRNNIYVGFNCRHRLVEPDTKGYDYSAKEIKKARKINGVMRSLENDARHDLVNSMEQVSYLRKEKYWNSYLKKKERAIQFAKQNNLPVYRWRLEI